MIRFIMQTSRQRAALLLLLGIGTASPAYAFSTGITGYSGKAGFSCTACHSGGVAPTVHFEGPQQLAPGASATYRFVVQSAAAAQHAAGCDVAVSGGKLTAIAGQGTRVLASELVHSSPLNNVDGSAAWEFTWQAPAQPGTATLFGAGNSVNLNGANFGDASATTTYQVVVDGVATATPTPTPPPAGGCVGDCNASGDVTVNEIVMGVNIALGSVAPSACPSFDFNQDGEVTVNELLQAVNAALNACP